MLIQFIAKVVRKSKGSLAGKLSSALVATLILNAIFGYLFYLAEKEAQEGLTLVDSIWWAMVTMTTVGYGDFYAQTWIGRFLVSYPCFLIGIGLIGYAVGVLAESMIEFTEKRKKGNSRIRMNNHTIICHCPSVPKVLQIVKELRATEHNSHSDIVVISNCLEELPIEFQKEKIAFIKGNPEEESVLKKANIDSASGVIILAKSPNDINSDSSSFTIVTIVELLALELNRDIKTIAELVSCSSEKLFSRTSVDGTVTVEGLTDKVMVQEFLHPGINNTFNQLLTNTSGSQLYNCPTKLTGHRLVDIQTAALIYELDLQIIGINRDNQQLLNPSKQINIKPGDKLIVLAEKKSDFSKFESDQLAKN